ncbi:hypothetical protein TNCV_2679471 [Trichonephila clavipes]|nr:hypothetical protein TNCV_2679471 [Trichonephila clavipes]
MDTVHRGVLPIDRGVRTLSEGRRAKRWAFNIAAFRIGETSALSQQLANIKFCVLLEKSPSETLEMLKKAHGKGSSSSEVLPASMAENKIERTSFCVDSDEVIQNATK